MTISPPLSAPTAKPLLKIPAALLGAAPRPVKPRTAGETRASLIFGIILFLVIGLAPWAFVGDRMALYNSGQRVSATVVGHITGTFRGTKTYSIQYAYEVGGHRYTDQEQVGWDEFYWGHPNGQAVQIKRINILGIETSGMFSKTSHWWFNTWLIVFVAAFFSGAVIATFCFGVRGTITRRRLIAQGVAVWGRIVGKDTVEDRGDSLFKRVTFRYRLRSGTWLEAKMRVDDKFYNGAVINQPVIVFYDPKDAENAVVYDACDLEVDVATQSNRKGAKIAKNAKNAKKCIEILS